MFISKIGERFVYKKFSFMVVLVCLGAFLNSAAAQEFSIRDWVFTWYAAQVDDVRMDIEKTPAGTLVVLHSIGGPIATIHAAPDQAVEIGKVLKNTNEYYEKQMKRRDMDDQDVIVSGNHKIYFTSSRGKNFQVSVRTTSMVSPAVMMTRNEALKIADSLLESKEMADWVDKRIHP